VTPSFLVIGLVSRHISKGNESAVLMNLQSFAWHANIKTCLQRRPLNTIICQVQSNVDLVHPPSLKSRAGNQGVPIMGASVLALGGLRRQKVVSFIEAFRLREYRLSTFDCTCFTCRLIAPLEMLSHCPKPPTTTRRGSLRTATNVRYRRVLHYVGPAA
jgi:hypothetical protein